MGEIDEGTVAVVTGGAGGLGAAVVRALAARGARVVVSDVREDAGEALAEEVDGLFVACDVTSLEENRRLMAAAVDAYGGLDVVHLNAGVATGFGLGDEFDEERYRQVMGVNLDGVVFGAHAAIGAMRAHGRGGAIVATASLAGLTSVPFDPLYAANKHAVVGLVRSLGPGLAGEGIRVNAVCPGFAESAIIDPIREMLGSQGIPIIPAERIGETVVTLAEGDMAGECWFVQAGRPAEPFGFRGIPGPRE